MAEIPVLIKLLAQRTSSVETVLRGTQRNFQDLAGSVTALGARSAAVFGGLSAGLVALGSAAVRTAGQFEALQAKLVSAMGSGERAAAAFASTLKFAADTPFDVQGLVQATVTLEAFRQRSQEVLPLAANLAAAFGKSVEDSALVLGKALSGSLEGFESLRNEYGITTIELKKFGAETLKTGGISVTTASQLAKARAALQSIIQTRYGDATARQSQTLFGALSNLGDAVSRVAATFGSELIPVVTTIGRTLTSVIEVFERLPVPMRQAIVFGGTLSAGLLAVAGVAAGLATTLVAGTAGLVAFAAALSGAGVAAGGTATVIGAAAVGFGALKVAVLEASAAGIAFAASPLGIALGLIAGVAGLLTLKLQQMKVANDGLSASLDSQSRTATQSANNWRTYSSELERAAGVGEGFLGTGGDVAATARLVNSALGGVGLADFVSRLQAAGLGVDDLKKKLSDNRQEANSNRESVQLLSDALSRLEKDQVREDRLPGTTASLSGLVSEADLAKITQMLGGAVPTVDNMTEAIKRMVSEGKKFGSTQQVLEGLIGKFDELAPVLDEATKSAQTFGEYMRLATKTDDITALKAVIGETDNRLQQVQIKLANAGIATSNLGDLQRRLLTATDDEAKAIKAYLALVDQREEAVKKVVSVEEKAVGDKIKLMETEAQFRKLAGDESTQKEREEIKALLGDRRLSSDQKLQLLNKEAAYAKADRAKELSAAREGFQETVLDARDAIEEVKTDGTSTSQEVADSITGVLANLREWEKANGAILKTSPELRKEFASTFAGFERQLKQTNAAIPKEKLEALLRSSKEFGAEAVTNTEKLAASKQAIDLLGTAMKSGVVKTTDERNKLEDEYNRRIRERGALELAIAKQVDAEVKKTRELATSVLEGEVALLEKRAALGDKFAASQLREAKEDLLAGKIQAINDLEKAEIDAQLAPEEAARRRELRLTQLRQEELKKRTDLEQQAADKELEIRRQLEGLSANRTGGANSPLISLQELGLQSQLAGFGSVGNTGTTRGLSRATPPQLFAKQNKTVAQQQAAVAADIDRAERGNSRRGGAGGVTDALLARGGRGTPASQTTNVVNNYNVPATPRVKRTLAQVGDEIEQYQGTKADSTGMFFGGSGPLGVK